MPAWITSLLRELVSLPISAVALEDDHLAAGKGQGAGDGEAHDPGTDDDGFDVVAHAP
jgi:hypothetical protein